MSLQGQNRKVTRKEREERNGVGLEVGQLTAITRFNNLF